VKAQRIVAPLLLVALVVGVVFAIVVSFTQQRGAQQRASQAAAIVTVRGLIGSEKADFFADPAVVAVLRKDGLEVQAQTSGSREMATRTDVTGDDFLFPAGVPAAKKIMSDRHIGQSFSPFYTPMAVASWKPIASILIANGVVRRDGADYYIVDMKRLVEAMAAHERWTDLKGHDAYAVSKSVLISSTDVRKSNSAAMYLSLASYLLNGDDVVQNESQVAKIAPTVAQLFLRQGYQESSSAGPFEDYTTIGMGKSPLVMVYEAQFIEYELQHPEAKQSNMILLYPKPTIYTKHVLVPLTPAGAKLGQLLESDGDLQHLAAQHGLRTADGAFAQSYWSKNGVRAPATLIDVVDPPSYEIIESMIKRIEAAFNAA